MGRIDLDARNKGHLETLWAYIKRVQPGRLSAVITDDGHIVLRPSVSTRGIDSMLVRNADEKMVKVFKEVVGPEMPVSYAERFWWNDDVKDSFRAPE